MRDWATFGLGVLGDTDTVEIRDALAARLSDANENAREEGTVALAKRKDRRVLSTLTEMLSQPEPTDRATNICIYIGLDVHKKTISYCVKDASGEIQKQATIPATRTDLDSWTKTLRSHGQ